MSNSEDFMQTQSLGRVYHILSLMPEHAIKTFDVEWDCDSLYAIAPEK